MTATEIRVPKFPACDEPCGACFDADDKLEVFVVDVLVKPGDRVAADALLAVVETNKTTLEVCAPKAGVVAEVRVRVADTVTEDSLLMTLGD